MRDSAGAVVSGGASIVLVAALAWAYLPRPVRDINVYYGSGVLNPLFAGVLAVGVIVAFVAAAENYISPALGAGVVLSLGLFVFLIVLAWALTGRVDVFRAPGWAYPAQRWVLVGLAALVLLGAGWYAWALDLLPPGR